MISFFKSKGKVSNVFTIAFYNLENLFDTINDPKTLDDDFTPEGSKHWNSKRYKRKLKKMGSVIAQLGTDRSEFSPALVGMVEVENKKVLNDLVSTKKMKAHNYAYVHYDSPDERGIDVTLLYKKELFELLHSESFPLLITDEDGQRDYTRDILMVKGNLNNELVYVLVNHWPSRRSGEDETEEKRIKAAQTVLHIVDSINKETENAKIIIMGDFNDDPTSKSIKNYLVTPSFYNPMEQLNAKGQGSLNHKHHWHLFDQIIFTRNFFEEEPRQHSFKYATIFDKHFLQEWSGKYRGNPFRTYVGKRYLGGFSDHFPVYIFLKLN